MLTFYHSLAFAPVGEQLSAHKRAHKDIFTYFEVRFAPLWYIVE